MLGSFYESQKPHAANLNRNKCIKTLVLSQNFQVHQRIRSKVHLAGVNLPNHSKSGPKTIPLFAPPCCDCPQSSPMTSASMRSGMDARLWYSEPQSSMDVVIDRALKLPSIKLQGRLGNFNGGIEEGCLLLTKTQQEGQPLILKNSSDAELPKKIGTNASYSH